MPDQVGHDGREDGETAEEGRRRGDEMAGGRRRKAGGRLEEGWKKAGGRPEEGWRKAERGGGVKRRRLFLL